MEGEGINQRTRMNEVWTWGMVRELAELEGWAGWRGQNEKL